MSFRKAVSRLQQSAKMITMIAAAAGIGALLGSVYRQLLPPAPKKIHEQTRMALLLGCPCHDDGTPSRSMLKRCDLALRCWREGKYDTLLISGGAVKNQWTESRAMEKIIHQAEPDLPILTETRAQNTWQNFEFAKEMIGDVPLLVLTSSLHAPRAAAMAKQFFSEVCFAVYPDRKPKHILREIGSRIVYLKMEAAKRFSKKQPADKRQDARIPGKKES